VHSRPETIAVERRQSQHDSPFAPIPAMLAGEIRHMAEAYNQSPRLLRILLRCHKVLSTFNLELEAPQAFERLRALLGDYGQALRRVPEAWPYSGDLARQMKLPHRKFIELMVAKGINQDHIAFISLPDTGGIFAFCSPELSMLLLGQSARSAK
jgi:hypothetical protein